MRSTNLSPIRFLLRFVHSPRDRQRTSGRGKGTKKCREKKRDKRIRRKIDGPLSFLENYVDETEMIEISRDNREDNRTGLIQLNLIIRHDVADS